ncbi:MAG: L-seryl-tRNA(Sec) selenium transferase [Planctomycetota bacterium]
MSKKNGNSQQILRNIPQVDRLLSLESFQDLMAKHSRAEVAQVVREDLDRLRASGGRGVLEEADVTEQSILGRVSADLEERAVPYYERVVNATGIVLHTGLGRSPLSPEVAAQIGHLVHHPLRVEIMLDSGQRGGRDLGCAELLKELTGCEAATVVNNNAGATLLVLAALARGKEVLLSRGEMVEIGGSYRVPDIMEEGGAKLVGVGTTNRTHLKDYAAKIGPETGMILKVHTSNYRVEGFTHEVEIDELVQLGREHGVPVVHDLGSGCLVDLEKHGIVGEPFVPNSVAGGADLICFSGDKLLGGPQAGIILGSEEAVQRCRKHQLFRALRPGRLTYVALEHTLRTYRQGEEAVLAKLPALTRLTMAPEKLKKRAQKLCRRLEKVDHVAATVVPCLSQAGSGSLPGRELASFAVRLEPKQGSVSELAARLRSGNPPVLARTFDDGVLLDLRTLDESEFALIEAALNR